MELSRIDIPKALAACKDSVKRHPETPRFKYQLARVIIAETVRNGGRDCSEVLALLEAAFDQDHAEAAFQISQCYSRGSGVPNDTQQRIKWLWRSFNLGSPTATAYLAIAAGSGYDGYEPDEDAAVKLLDQLAAAGNTTALVRMSDNYRYGTWVEKDPERSFAYLLRAAERGHLKSQHSVGILFMTGQHGAKLDRRRALEFLTLAAEAGHVHAGRKLEELTAILRVAPLPEPPKTSRPGGKPAGSSLLPNGKRTD